MNADRMLARRSRCPAGANACVAEDGFFDLFLATYLPLSAPIYLAKKAKPKGPVVLSAETYIVDLYVTVDGAPQQQAWVCFGEAGKSNEEAIAYAEQRGMEPTVLKALKDGPPGSVRPFASLAATNFKNDYFAHIPLICSGDMDQACLKESKEYGPKLMTHFAELLGQVGGGTHTWTFRVSPRGIVQTSPDVQIGCHGQFNKGCGLDAEDYMKADSGFAATVEKLAAQAHVAADLPVFRATLQLTVPDKFCSGSGPERLADEFNKNFSKDVAEYCGYALEVAPSGASGAAARKVLGSLGPVAHITIAGHDLAGGWTPLGGNGVEKSGERITAWAYWKHPNDDDSEAEGVMVDFWAIRYDRKNHQNVANPEQWYSEDKGMFRCNGLKIKNKNIDAAIERDAGIWNVP